MFYSHMLFDAHPVGLWAIGLIKKVITKGLKYQTDLQGWVLLHIIHNTLHDYSNFEF